MATKRENWVNALPRYYITRGGRIIRHILMPNGRWEEEKFGKGPSPFEDTDFGYLEGLMASLRKPPPEE